MLFHMDYELCPSYFNRNLSKHLARRILEKEARKQQLNTHSRQHAVLSSFILSQKVHLRIFTRVLPAPAIICWWFCEGAGACDTRTDAFSEMPLLSRISLRCLPCLGMSSNLKRCRREADLSRAAGKWRVWQEMQGGTQGGCLLNLNGL